MALTVNPAAALRLSPLDTSRYDSFQTIVAFAKSPNNAVVTRVSYNLPISLNQYTANPVKYYNDALNKKIGINSYAVLTHDVDNFTYIAISNFATRVFHVLFKDQDTSLTDTMTDAATKFINMHKPLLWGGNGPFFTEQSVDTTNDPHAKDHHALLGPCYQNNNPIYTNFQQPKSDKTDAIQWDSVNKLQFLINKGAKGGDGFSSLPPILEGGNKIDSPTYVDATDTKKGHLNIQRHIVAYNPTTDVLSIILKHFTILANTEIANIRENLKTLGYQSAVFFDGASSVVLWKFDDKGIMREIFKANLFDTIKDEYLHIGYGIT